MKEKNLKIKTAVYLFLIKDNKILLSKRKNTNWSDGSYTLPSGHIDLNEVPTQALLREAKEELSINVKLEDIELIYTLFERNAYIDFYFLCNKWEEKIINNEPKKCSELKWVKIKNIDNYNIAEKVKKSIKNILKGIYFGEIDTTERNLG